MKKRESLIEMTYKTKIVFGVVLIVFVIVLLYVFVLSNSFDDTSSSQNSDDSWIDVNVQNAEEFSNIVGEEIEKSLGEEYG